MSIINTTYFKGEIYLPHAKPGISNTLTDVEVKVNNFIDEYEQDCLVKSLGIRLADEFFKELDTSEPTYIKSGSDVKWDELLNGKEYTRSNGDNAFWKGIRRPQKTLGVAQPATLVYDVSFLAYYVYFYYESNAFITRGNAGSGNVKGANMEMVVPDQKVVKSWNHFVKMVQGDGASYNSFVKSGLFGGVGVDYYNENENLDVSMYQFINDMNDATEDTYQFFEPQTWAQLNEFGI